MGKGEGRFQDQEAAGAGGRSRSAEYEVKSTHWREQDPCQDLQWSDSPGREPEEAKGVL